MNSKGKERNCMNDTYNSKQLREIIRILERKLGGIRRLSNILLWSDNGSMPCELR